MDVVSGGAFTPAAANVSTAFMYAARPALFILPVTARSQAVSQLWCSSRAARYANGFHQCTHCTSAASHLRARSRLLRWCSSCSRAARRSSAEKSPHGSRMAGRTSPANAGARTSAVRYSRTRRRTPASARQTSSSAHTSTGSLCAFSRRRNTAYETSMRHSMSAAPAPHTASTRPDGNGRGCAAASSCTTGTGCCAGSGAAAVCIGSACMVCAVLATAGGVSCACGALRAGSRAESGGSASHTGSAYASSTSVAAFFSHRAGKNRRASGASA